MILGMTFSFPSALLPRSLMCARMEALTPRPFDRGRVAPPPASRRGLPAAVPDVSAHASRGTIPTGIASKLELIATPFKDVVVERLHLRIRLGELARSRGPSSLPYCYVASR